MPDFDYESFSPLHYQRLTRTKLEDLERSLNLMEVCYKMRLYALLDEIQEDMERIRQEIRYIKKL